MQQKKGIIFANQSSGSLMLDIVNVFARSGKYEKILLFTGAINIRPTKPDESVVIYKTIKYNRKNTITRFFTWVFAFLNLLLVIVFKSRKYELFLVSNPPLNFFIPLFLKNQFSLLVYDIYPETLVAQNVFADKSWLTKNWRNANIKVFGRAKQVFTISNDMKNILQKYVEVDRIKVIYNWIHPIKKVDRATNQFLINHGIENKFIVLYSGNMGLTHDLDALVDVANLLQEHKDVCFLFIGEGGKKKAILSKIEQFGLKNCLVLPYQPNEMLPQTMGGANIGVVTLDSGSDSLSIPSKTNRYLALGVPLLCVAHKNSELSTIVERNDVGKCFTKTEHAEMAGFILEMKQNTHKYQAYSYNANELSKSFSPKNAESFLK